MVLAIGKAPGDGPDLPETMMPMPYDLLTPQLQALVAAAGLATACSFIDAVQSRVSGESAGAPLDPHSEAAPQAQRARLLLPPNR